MAYVFPSFLETPLKIEEKFPVPISSNFPNSLIPSIISGFGCGFGFGYEEMSFDLVHFSL